MGDPVWNFLALPVTYFSTIFMPLSGGVVTAVPALGVVGLIVGVIWGIVVRRRGLLLFLTLPVASHALVAVGDSMRRSLPPENGMTILCAFLLLQLALAGYFIIRLKGARLPAAALAVFTSSYALLAAFFVMMGFPNSSGF
jgi:hypothetical protein